MSYNVVFEYTTGTMRGIRTFSSFDGLPEFLTYWLQSEGEKVVAHGLTREEMDEFVAGQDLWAAGGLPAVRDYLAKLDFSAGDLLRAANSPDPRLRHRGQFFLRHRIGMRDMGDYLERKLMED
jgi:hypothetical protein